MYLRPSACGGIFSIIALVFMLAMISSLAIPFAIDNAFETRSLIPLFSARVAKITSDVSFSLLVESYGGKCSIDNICAPAISYSLNNFVASKSQNMTCANMRDGCLITILLNQVAFTQGQASVQISINDKFTYASAFATNTTVSTGKHNSVSSIAAYISSGSNQFFRGLTNPTTLVFNTFESTYTDLQNSNNNGTGFLIDFRTVTKGDLVNNVQFNQRYATFFHCNNCRNGLQFAFLFVRESNVFEIIQNTKKSIPSFISELLGSAAGMIGLIGSVMACVESSTVQVMKKVYRYDVRQVNRILEEAATKKAARKATKLKSKSPTTVLPIAYPEATQQIHDPV